MVPEEGFEPSQQKLGDFESPVSTNSTIQAFFNNGGALLKGPINTNFLVKGII